MVGWILDSIPVVGHVKGVLHYITGDNLAARRSMYEATRSTAVIAGGAAGAIGGPAGIAAGAAAGGAATDAVTSLVMQNPQGIVAGIADIADDISNGDNPLGSIAKTTLIIGTDMIGGAAGPTIGNCVSKAVTESTGKKIVLDITKKGVEKVVATRLAHGYTRSVLAFTEPPVEFRVERCRSNSSRNNSQQSNQESSQRTNQQTNQESSQRTNQQTNQERNTGNPSDKESSTSDNSGGQQQGNNNNNNPDDNKNKQDNCNNTPTTPESHWGKFRNIFGVKKLEDIIIKGIKLFNDIEKYENRYQKKELKNFIIQVNNNDKDLELSTIIKITEELISELDPNQVTAHNFVNLGKFVLAYLCQERTDEMELFCKSTRNFTTDRNTVTQKILQADNTVTKVVNVFNALMNEIDSLSSMLNPKFVNAIAAVYHYFKHKFIKAKNRLFAPAEYINLAREGLDRMRSLPQIERLQKSGVKRIVYEKYYEDVGRRLVIVIKEQKECWNVSSVYFEDDSHDGDEDGDEWINGEKVPRCF